MRALIFSFFLFSTSLAYSATYDYSGPLEYSSDAPDYLQESNITTSANFAWDTELSGFSTFLITFENLPVFTTIDENNNYAFLLSAVSDVQATTETLLFHNQSTTSYAEVCCGYYADYSATGTTISYRYDGSLAFVQETADRLWGNVGSFTEIMNSGNAILRLYYSNNFVFNDPTSPIDTSQSNGSSTIYFTSFEPNSNSTTGVPEPSTLLLLLTGLIGLTSRKIMSKK